MKDLYDKILENNKNSQILRFEVQLNKKRMIKARMLDYYLCLGYDKETITQKLKSQYSTEYGLFHNLCNPRFSKWILNLYWNKVKSCINLPKTENDLKRIIDKILQDKNQFKTGKLLANIGAIYLICIYGTKVLREISAKKCREIEKLLEEIKLNSYYKTNPFDKVSEDLKTFQSIKPAINELEEQIKCEEASCYLKSGAQVYQELKDRFEHVYRDKPEENPFKDLVKTDIKQLNNKELDNDTEDNFDDENEDSEEDDIINENDFEVVFDEEYQLKTENLNKGITEVVIEDDELEEASINQSDFEIMYNKKHKLEIQNLNQQMDEIRRFEFDEDIHYKYEPPKRDFFVKTTSMDVKKRKEFNKNLEQKLISQLKPKPKIKQEEKEKSEEEHLLKYTI